MDSFPRGTVTFLFTDIEGSTRLWEDVPDEMPAAYARHDAIVRESVSRHGGQIYKTIGDAFQIVFPTVLQGIRGAVDAQVALQAESWRLPRPLKVRMALHTGDIDPDANGDYRSPVLNRLGRLLGAGHGAQVLASRAIVDAIAGLMPEEATFIDLGARRLKDLGLPEHVYQLAAPGLGQSFPALRTLDVRPHNLPTLLSRFIGRKDEVRTLREIVGRSGSRIVTLTGPGGIGKTRLALQVTAEVLEQFADGVFLVRLETIGDPEHVLPAIARTLGLEEREDVDSAVGDYLRDKHMLLILDNLEHVLGSANRIADLVRVCPRLHVLGTSRARLQLQGEYEYPISPLGLPDVAGHRSLTTLSEFDSLVLFTDRAQLVKPGFRLTDENAWMVSEICLRLDGIPLAIELAAARTRMFPLEALLKRLSVRLPLLTGGARDLPERQRTLRQTVAWSYSLLDEPGQALFRRLSVFAGGATPEAIEAVAVDKENGWDAPGVLDRLVEHSLIRQTELDGEPRFAMYEVIREFGLEQLAEEGEADEAHRRHAMYFAMYPGIEYGAPAEEAVRKVDLVEIERDNIRVAREWTLRHDLQLAYQLLDRKGVLWQWRVPTIDELRWTRAVIAANPPGIDREMRARCCMISAYLGFWFPRDTAGLEISLLAAEEALAIFRDMNEPVWVVRTLIAASDLEISRGHIAESGEYRREAVEVARVAGDPIRLCQALCYYGEYAQQSGDLAHAKRLLEEAIAIARGIPDRTDVQVAILDSLGDLDMEEGRLESAAGHFGEALALSLDDRQARKRIGLIVALAVAEARLGHWERVVWLGGVIRTMRANDETPIVAELLPGLREHDGHLFEARNHLKHDVIDELLRDGGEATLEEIVERAAVYMTPEARRRLTALSS